MHQSHPSITVIIPTYNRCDYLAECIDSLLGQTYPPTQIIIVNDRSSDDTKGVLKPYYDKVEYYETNQLGKLGAVNLGLKHTTGKYVWMFGCLMMTMWLSQMLLNGLLGL